MGRTACSCAMSGAEVFPRAAVAKHKYAPQTAGELALEAGQDVTLLDRINADWLLVSAGDRQGRVPAAYIIDPAAPSQVR